MAGPGFVKSTSSKLGVLALVAMLVPFALAPFVSFGATATVIKASDVLTTGSMAAAMLKEKVEK